MAAGNAHKTKVKGIFKIKFPSKLHPT